MYAFHQRFRAPFSRRIIRVTFPRLVAGLILAWAFARPVSAEVSETVWAVEQGTVRFAQRSHLTFGATGKIDEMVVDEGASVVKGQILARLADEVAQANFAEASAAAESRAPMEVAHQELRAATEQYDAVKRANRLHERAFSPVRETELKIQRDRALAIVRQRQEESHQAKLARDTASRQVESLKLCAPFSGTIVRRLKHPGEGVAPTDSVLELVNDRDIRVDVFVSPEIATRLAKGMAASISELKSSSRSIQGRVGFVDLTVQPVRQVIRVWVEAERPEWLLDGSQVEVAFLSAATP